MRGYDKEVPSCDFIILLADMRLFNRDHQLALCIDWVEDGNAEIRAGKP